MKLSDTDSGSPTVSVAADTAGNSDSSSSKEAYVQVEDDDNDGNRRRKVDDVWLRVQNMVLRLSDKAVLLNGELNDKVSMLSKNYYTKSFRHYMAYGLLLYRTT